MYMYMYMYILVQGKTTGNGSYMYILLMEVGHFQREELNSPEWVIHVHHTCTLYQSTCRYRYIHVHGVGGCVDGCINVHVIG